MDFMNFSFSDVDWGEDEAGDDYRLVDSFVEFPGFDSVLNGRKRFVIGRKGTGKSAVLKRIKLIAENDPQTFFSDISLRDFPVNAFKGLGDAHFRDKSKHVPTWKFLILTEVARMLIADNSIANTREKSELSQFIDENFPKGIGIADTVSFLIDRSSKISVLSSWISGEVSKSTSEDRFISVHFHTVCKCLQEKLLFFTSNSRYYILADQLDEGFSERDASLRLVILSLLRACQEVATSFSLSRINCFPVVALRTDIFDNLEDNDLNKLDDYILRINWTTYDDGDWSLKRIIEKRLIASFKTMFPDFKYDLSGEALWNKLFDDSSARNGLFKYICALTFSRPRDIIKLMKYCAEDGLRKKLTYSDLRAVEDKYSDWFFRELRDEIQSFLPCWKSALNCLTEIALGKAEVTVLEMRLNENITVKTWLDENKKDATFIIELLFSYSAIGCINEHGRWIFKYKDNLFEFMRSYKYYCVHYGLCKKLRIISSYEPLILAEIYYQNN